MWTMEANPFSFSADGAQEWSSRKKQSCNINSEKTDLYFSFKLLKKNQKNIRPSKPVYRSWHRSSMTFPQYSPISRYNLHLFTVGFLGGAFSFLLFNKPNESTELQRTFLKTEPSLAHTLVRQKQLYLSFSLNQVLCVTPPFMRMRWVVESHSHFGFWKCPGINEQFRELGDPVDVKRRAGEQSVSSP